jgi:hypothetical protein
VILAAEVIVSPVFGFEPRKRNVNVSMPASLKSLADRTITSAGDGWLHFSVKFCIAYYTHVIIDSRKKILILKL